MIINSGDAPAAITVRGNGGLWRNIYANGTWQRDACQGLKDIVVTNE